MTAESVDGVSTLFEALCRTRSQSLSEGAISAQVKGLLESFGFAFKEDDAAAQLGGEAGNLICHIPGADATKTIVICAHLDTVPTGEVIEPVCVDGRWSNDGDGILGVDNKAAVSALLTAIQKWSDQPPAVNVTAVFTVAEEISLQGAKQLDFSQIDASAAFFFDHPTPIGSLVTRSPAHHAIQIEFIGRPAHAAVEPEAGSSAIKAAATAIEAYPNGRVSEATTSNFGVVAGGSAINVVPERCSVLAEVRSLDPSELTTQTRLLIDAAHEGAGQHGCEADVVVVPSFRGYEHADSHVGMVIAHTALGAVGIESEPITSAGGSDANVFEEHGIPSVNMGDGSSATHTASESILDSDLHRLVEVILALPKAASEVI